MAGSALSVFNPLNQADLSLHIKQMIVISGGPAIDKNKELK